MFEVRSTPIMSEPGLAARFSHFAELDAFACGSAGVEPPSQVTTAMVVGLLVRSVATMTVEVTDDTTGEVENRHLSARAIHLLLFLAEHVYDKARWTRCDTDLKVVVGNARIAAFLGIDPRTVRSLLKELEFHGWILRRYNQANKRGDLAGIDLRPLARRVGELIAHEEEIEEKLAADRETIRGERNDALAVVTLVDAMSAYIEAGELSAGEDENTHLKSYKPLNPEQSSVQGKGASQVMQGQRAEKTSSANPSISAKTPTQEPNTAGDKRGGMFREVDPSEYLFLMLHASQTLQRALRPDELADRDPVAVARAVNWIVRNHLRFRPGAWKAGLERHGWAAMAAAVVAVDRADIRDRAGYLHKMLAASNLGTTVLYSLRQLAEQPWGRA